MKAIESEWIFTSPIDFSEAETRKLNESSFRTLPSPYVTPTSVRVVFDDVAKKRALELRYLGEESTTRGTYADGCEIEYGRRTLRPHVIVVQMDGSDSVSRFISKVEAALESFVKVQSLSSDRHFNSHDRERLKMTVSHIRSLIRAYQAELIRPSI